MTSRRWIVGGVIVFANLLAASACGPGTVPSGQPPLTMLTAQSIESLRQEFNRAREHTRVVLLLSPT